MHASRLFVILIMLVAAMRALSPIVVPVRAQEQATPAISQDGAFGLQVVTVRPLPQSSGIQLIFDEPSATRLRNFSERASGHDVDFVVGVHVITTLKLRDPILGNSVMLTGPFSSDDVSTLESLSGNRLNIRMHR